MRDAEGNLLVVQEMGLIHRIDASGVLHTIVGAQGPSTLRDGAAATSGRVEYIPASALGARGAVVFAERETLRLWTVDIATGLARIIAGRGRGAPEGPPDQARAVALGFMLSLASDAAGNLYVGEIPEGIRRIDAATRRVVTIAPRAALPANPTGLLWVEPDTLFVAFDSGHVRRLLPGGGSVVVAGGGAGF